MNTNLKRNFNAIFLAYEELSKSESQKEREIKRLKKTIQKLNATIQDYKNKSKEPEKVKRIDYRRYMKLFEEQPYNNVNEYKTLRFTLQYFLLQNGWSVVDVGKLVNKHYSTVMHGRDYVINKILKMPKAFPNEINFLNELNELKDDLKH